MTNFLDTNDTWLGVVSYNNPTELQSHKDISIEIKWFLPYLGLHMANFLDSNDTWFVIMSYNIPSALQ